MFTYITNPQEIQRHMENLAWLSAKEEGDVAITPQPKKSWEQRPKRKSKSQIQTEKHQALWEEMRKKAEAIFKMPDMTVNGRQMKMRRWNF